jgi:hypothetical protein
MKSIFAILALLFSAVSFAEDVELLVLPTGIFEGDKCVLEVSEVKEAHLDGYAYKIDVVFPGKFLGLGNLERGFWFPQNYLDNNWNFENYFDGIVYLELQRDQPLSGYYTDSITLEYFEEGYLSATVKVEGVFSGSKDYVCKFK